MGKMMIAVTFAFDVLKIVGLLSLAVFCVVWVGGMVKLLIELMRH
jgi:hypothetical protein